MATKGVGTNLQTQAQAGVQVAMCNDVGNATLVFYATANAPSGTANYAIGCLGVDTTTGILYCNTGTASSCTFVKVSGT